MAINNTFAGLIVKFSGNVDGLLQSSKQAANSLKVIENQARQVQTILSGLGLGFGLYGVVTAVKDAVKTFADFDYTMAEVKAITNATSEQFKELEADAIRLGKSTVFTARQVGQLQVAYGRLGFSSDEIIKATEATLNLAAATNSELADAADVAGSTVRGFQLDASETIRVTDVMTSSFNKTALAIDNFREGMKFVAPVANAANATVEETTALLGVLANAGIKGSIAGTSLRRIFTDLTKDGSPLSARLKELADKGLTLQSSFDEVGRIAQTALLVLSRNIDQYESLTSVFNKAAGEGERVANIRLDNLQGDFIRLQSAIEGVIISGRAVSPTLRDFTQDLTTLVSAINDTSSASKSLIAVWFDMATVIPRYTLKAIAFLADGLKGISALRIRSGNFDAFGEDVVKTSREAKKSVSSLSLSYIKLQNDLKSYIEQYQKADPKDGIRLNSLTDKITNTTDKLNELIAIDVKSFFDKFKIKIEDNYPKLPEFPTKAVLDDAEKTAKTLEELYQIQDALNKQFKSDTQIVNSDEQKALGQRIIRLDEQIKKIEALRQKSKNTNKELEDLNKRFEFIIPEDAGFVVPDVLNQRYVNEQKELAKELSNELTSGLAAGMTAVTVSANTMGEAISDNVKKFKDVIIDISPIVQDAFVGIGFAIGDAISESQTLGDGLLNVFGDILVQLGQIAISVGIGIKAINASFESLNPAIATAAGIALIALGRSISGSVRNLGNSRGGGGSSSSSRSGSDFSSIAFAQDTALGIRVDDMVIRGQDLYVIMSTYNRNNRSTGNG